MLAARILQRWGYRPPASDLAGYKTFVDPKSEKNLNVPESNPQTRGPQELPQSREKERALPLPSDHDEKRDKVIGPTNYNKPDSSGGPKPRTVSVPGEQYGNPVKNDYGYPRRRKDVTGKRVTFPQEHQKETKGPERQQLQNDYRRDKPRKRLTEKLRYRQEGKRDPDRKRYNKLYEKYPKRFERRKPGEFATPAERTKAWREDQEGDAERAGRTPKEQAEHRKKDKKADQDPTTWYTVTKETVPPGNLDQNFRDKPKGAPRRDKTKQEGESLRAPNLDSKPQKGLRTEIQPKPNSGVRRPTVQSPGDGSGKVIPNGLGYTNHSQELGETRPYAQNVEQAKTGFWLLARIVAYTQRADPSPLF